MKLSFAFLAFLLFASCSNNTTPGSNNNNSNGSTIYGANYFPLTDNTALPGHISGTITHLDTNGNVTGTDEIDQDYNASIGFVETHDGQNVHPIYGSDGGSPVAYGGILDSEVFAMNHYINSGAATILPQSMRIGQSWTPYPQMRMSCQARLVQRLSQFTNKGGTSYSDVLQVSVTYLDSLRDSEQTNFGPYIYEKKYSANADLYFAKGIGLVEADVHNYEYYFIEEYYYFYGFEHETATGTVWRRN
ncbi:MAG TPA: hypothetical protein VFH95_07545 [Candidatus Kapabacteria bacterium]|nr:hypothetical protein [Candidatus Kapabacteria bacterium]